MRVLFLITSLVFADWSDLAGASEQRRRDPASEAIFMRLYDQLGNLPGHARAEKYITPTYGYASKVLVEQAAMKLDALLANEDRRKQMFAMEESPANLKFAVMFGLSEIVETVLRYPEAKVQIDQPPRNGLHLWTLATVALAQSSRVCGDPHLDGFGFLQGYFGTDPMQSPYLKIREMLEKAGAKPYPKEAKAFWISRCTPADPNPLTGEPQGPVEYIPGARDRVAQAPDILNAILAEIQSQVTPQGLPKPRF